MLTTINKIKHLLRHWTTEIFGLKENKVIQKILQNNPQPIYHLHIRKTAGTTINFAFLSNANSQNTQEFFSSIVNKFNHRQIRNNKIFIGWNTHLINKGHFSYAFSHEPFHKLNLPSKVFIFTCLRDPVKRVLSHYNMLKYFQINDINHPCMKIEGKWLGHSFDDFLSNLPKEHLLNQVYMFSSTFDTQEAREKLLSLNKIIYTENIEEGLKDLELMTNWKLPISNQNKFNYKEELSSSQINRLRDKLIPEYELLASIKKQ